MRRKSSLSEKPEPHGLRRLVQRINPAGNGRVHSQVDRRLGTAARAQGPWPARARASNGTGAFPESSIRHLRESGLRENCTSRLRGGRRPALRGASSDPTAGNVLYWGWSDMWMQREFPSIAFERYADDAVCHCRTEAQARYLKARLERRFAECRLELHPEKTKIVYCKDDNRAGEFPQTKFDFLGYTFRSRLVRRGDGKFFVGFSPAISNKAAKAIRQTVRGWALQRRTNQSLHELAQAYDPAIRGWVNYYGAFHKSALWPTLRQIDRKLAWWAHSKHKRLRGHKRRAAHWVRRTERRDPDLFAHWCLMYGRAG